MKGSVAPFLSTAFTYTNNASTITWAWTSLTIYRADGTTTNIGTGTKVETGLAAATTYYFYPYYDETNAVLAWVNGSGHGTDGIAFLAAQRSNTLAQSQALQAHTPLSSGPISAVTTASGGGGGGGGGGSGNCVRSNMLVEEKTKGIIPAYEIETGDFLKSKDGWVEVQRAYEAECDLFVQVCVNGHYLDVTPWHPFEAMDEFCQPMGTEASRLTLFHQLHTIDGTDFVSSIEMLQGKGQKMVIECGYPHTFYAGEDKPYILAHNMILGC